MSIARSKVRTPGLLPTCALLLLALCTEALAAQTVSTSPRDPDRVLRGTVRSNQNHTYLQVPFEVPANTSRLTLTFEYTGKEQHTALDLGLLDPGGLRCWSGGNKTTLTIADAEATPSCLPGKLPSGTWKLLIGIPNIRVGVTSSYTANLFFNHNGLVQDEPGILQQAIRSGPAWYRGDLHMHTAHSDGSCASQSGKMVPCPVFLTVDAAARRGLDFIAITDHNTTSHYDSMRELTPYYDNLLLIPGREITTFEGHANVFGTKQFLDFRLGSAGVPTIDTLLHRANALGALVSLNHPGAPTGERCMGCGWTPSPAADMDLVQAIEAVNSGAEEGPYSGTPFWEKQLNEGYRITAVGGSDNHNAKKPLDQVGSIGSPTTVVYAEELSTPAILGAIRAGHVFVDLTGSRDKLFELHATAGSRTVSMGDSLDLPTGSSLRLDARVVKAASGTLVWIEDGKPINGQGSAIADEDQILSIEWKSDGQRHWLRTDVRGPDGHLWLLGNPIYVNWPRSQSPTHPGEPR